MAEQYPDALKSWLSHVRTVLPALKTIRAIERPEDKHCYFVMEFEGGLKVPSWFVSDGTLRLLALTAIAYLPNLSGSYLIEEPENGIHPLALQAVFDSLGSVYDAQILIATHSPLVLGLAQPDNILCFSQTDEGATRIVRGPDHPKLTDWQGQPTFDVLFASGILG